LGPTVANIWENIRFSKVFHSFGHASTDSKNECFPDFWIEIRCFARISIVTKIKDGALVALVVASSKYGENIHLSKVGYLWCLGGNKYMGKHSFFQGFLQVWACPH
jgi:hypothetical protein